MLVCIPKPDAKPPPFPLAARQNWRRCWQTIGWDSKTHLNFVNYFISLAIQ
jgi:hypothetical protein